MADPGSPGRFGSWLPMWRVAGALFIAYPVVRIILEPPARSSRWPCSRPPHSSRCWSSPSGDADPDDAARRQPVFAVMVLGILVLAAAIVASSPDQGWLALFYYASTGASMLLPERRAVALILAAARCARSACRSRLTSRARSSRASRCRSSGSRSLRCPRCDGRTRSSMPRSRSSRRWPSPRSATGSPATSTTSSATACRSSRSRASWLAGCCPGTRIEPGPRSPMSNGSLVIRCQASATRLAETASPPSKASSRTPGWCSTPPGSHRRRPLGWALAAGRGCRPGVGRARGRHQRPATQRCRTTAIRTVVTVMRHVSRSSMTAALGATWPIRSDAGGTGLRGLPSA